MPADYRLYHVGAFSIRPGKQAEALEWFRDAQEVVSSMPGVIEVRAYASQFGLGEPQIEIWTEIEDYATFDRWDEDIVERGAEFRELMERMSEALESEGGRLVGDWPGSDLGAD